MTDIDTAFDVSQKRNTRSRWDALKAFSDLNPDKRDTILLFLVRGGGAVFAFLTQIAIARWAGAGTFGIYAIAWTWIMVLGTLSQAGFGVAMTRFVSRYMERERPERAWQVIVFSAQFVTKVGIVTSFIAIGTVFFLSEENIAAATTSSMLLAMTLVPLYGLSELGQGVLRGLGDNMRAFVPGFLLRPVVLFALVSLAFISGLDIDATLVVASLGISLLFVVALQWHWIWHRGRGLEGKNHRRWHAGHWISVAVPMVMTDAYLLLVSYMDLLVLDLYVSPEKVAVYFAAVKIIALVWFFPFAVSGVSARLLAQVFERGDMSKLKNLVFKFIHWSFWPTFILSILLMISGDRILVLFGDGFADGLFVLQILACGLIFQSAAGPIKYLMTMTEEQNSSAVILIFAACANIGLNFLLIPIWGLEGAAVATVGTQVFATGLMVIQTWRRLGVWSFLPCVR